MQRWVAVSQSKLPVRPKMLFGPGSCRAGSNANVPQSPSAVRGANLRQHDWIEGPNRPKLRRSVATR